jgi:GcrA cell cycle regulator
MEPTNWAPEHSDALREHLAKGMSFSEIAKAINFQGSTPLIRATPRSVARGVWGLQARNGRHRRWTPSL